MPDGSKLSLCFAGLLLASFTPASAELRQVYFVINAHGAKTSVEFALPASISVYVPADLKTAYSYEDDKRDPKGIERIFSSGRLPGYDRASVKERWKRYPAEALKVPDVTLAPLNFDKNLPANETRTTRELAYLKKRMDSEKDHWSYDTGPDSVLFVRRESNVEKIIGHDAVKRYMDSYNVPAAAYTELNAPIVLAVPKQNKVKVLGKTSLSEVVSLLFDAFGGQTQTRINVLMAACNEQTGQNERIILSTNAKRATMISDLLAK